MTEPDANQDQVSDLVADACVPRAQAGRWAFLSGRLLLALGLFQLALIVILVLANWKLQKSVDRARQPVRPAAYAAGNRAPVFQGNPGPWGVLEYSRIAIEPPDEFVPTDEVTFEKTRWFFGGYTREQLATFFNSCDLTAAQRAELLNTNSWSNDTNGVVVMPGMNLILEMSRQARAKIYSTLADDGRNLFQAWPYTCRNDGFDEWFQHSEASAAAIAQVKRLMYPRGTSLCFSDLPAVFSQIPTLYDRRETLQTLLRNTTVLMKLRVPPHGDFKALTKYWQGDEVSGAKDIEPLLESLAELPDGMSIDVMQLLPPFARKRLNTYPEPDASNRWPDCYWTAMNFFNDPPDDRYYDPDVWSNELKTNYTAVSAPTFGDVIFFLRPDDVPLHAAVYIADDVLFTKNGGNNRQPWIFMKWDDLIARYPENYPVHTAVFRSNQRMKK